MRRPPVFGYTGLMTDLPALAFIALRKRFFDDEGTPIPFDLRDKLNTQDDPLDEFLAQRVLAERRT